MSGPKEAWGSRIGVILAVTGSAVGLGNFLRFPGLAAKYEGGAFMVPYFISLLLLGLPLAWAEWSMGRYGGKKGFHSATMIMGAIGKGKLARYLGVLGVLIPLGVSTVRGCGLPRRGRKVVPFETTAPRASTSNRFANSMPLEKVPEATITGLLRRSSCFRPAASVTVRSGLGTGTPVPR